MSDNFSFYEVQCDVMSVLDKQTIDLFRLTQVHFVVTISNQMHTCIAACDTDNAFRVTIRKRFKNGVRRICKNCTCAELARLSTSFLREACCLNKDHAAVKCCGLCREHSVQCDRSYRPPAGYGQGEGRAGGGDSSDSSDEIEQQSRRLGQNSDYYMWTVDDFYVDQFDDEK